MSIQRKLTFLLAVIGAILGLFAGAMAWNAALVTAEMRTVRAEAGNFKDLGRIRVFHYRQMHLATQFLLSGREESKSDFNLLDGEIVGLFKALRRGARREADREKLSSVETDYRRIIALVQTAFALKTRGKMSEAVAVLEGQAEPLSTGIFQKKADDLMALYVLRIEGSYDETILHLGALPWLGARNLKTIDGARSAIRYYNLLDKTTLLINGQVKELLDYLIAPTDANSRELENYNVDVKRAFAEWEKIIQGQEVPGVPGEDGDLKVMRTVEHAYHEILESARNIHALASAGRARESLEPLESRTLFMIDNILLSTLDAALYDSRKEIEDAHNRLIASTMTAGAFSLAVVVGIGLALFWASHRLVRELISGIQELKTGTEIIGSGYLDHRIVVAGNDELGSLAQSFNRMTDSLKDGNEDLRSFIYSLSHDLRSPLVNIKGFSGELGGLVRELDALLRRSRVSSDERDRVRLQNILENDLPASLRFIVLSTERISEHMNAVLKLSLVGQRELKPERLDMTSLFRSAESRFAGELLRRNATMHIEDLPWVIADGKAMQEVISQLLDNAVKYLDPRRPGLVTVFGQRTEEGALIHVRDNGRGIAKEDLDKIFGLFRRAGRQDIPGDGMGLAYVKALVRRHNGRIWCESQINAGTTFSLSVPDAKFIGETK